MWCRLYQWLISGAIDSDRRPGRATMRHIARCPRCRRFWLATLRLEDRLHEQAASAVAPAPEVRGAGRSGWAVFRRPLLAGAAAAAIVVLLAVAMMRPAPNQPLRPPAPAAAPPGLAELASTFGLDAAQLAPLLDEPASGPIRDDLGDLARDAQAATQALLTYLPISEEQITGGN